MIVAKDVAERVGLPFIAVSGLWLRRVGDFVEMLAEDPSTGEFILIASEHFDGPFSHIAEPNGIQSKFYDGRRKGGKQ